MFLGSALSASESGGLASACCAEVFAVWPEEGEDLPFSALGARLRVAKDLVVAALAVRPAEDRRRDLGYATAGRAWLWTFGVAVQAHSLAVDLSGRAGGSVAFRADFAGSLDASAAQAEGTRLRCGGDLLVAEASGAFAVVRSPGAAEAHLPAVGVATGQDLAEMAAGARWQEDATVEGECSGCEEALDRHRCVRVQLLRFMVGEEGDQCGLVAWARDHTACDPDQLIAIVRSQACHRRRELHRKVAVSGERHWACVGRRTLAWTMPSVVIAPLDRSLPVFAIGACADADVSWRRSFGVHSSTVQSAARTSILSR